MFHPAHSLHVPLCSAESRCFVNIASLSLTFYSFSSLSSPIFGYLFSTTLSPSLSLSFQFHKFSFFSLTRFLSQTSLSITFALHIIQSLSCQHFRFLVRQKTSLLSTIPPCTASPSYSFTVVLRLPSLCPSVWALSPHHYPSSHLLSFAPSSLNPFLFLTVLSLPTFLPSLLLSISFSLKNQISFIDHSDAAIFTVSLMFSNIYPVMPGAIMPQYVLNVITPHTKMAAIEDSFVYVQF